MFKKTSISFFLLIALHAIISAQVISGGDNCSLTICSDSTVKSFGDDHNGRLGRGSLITTGCHCDSFPGPVMGLTKIVSVAAGIFSLALKSDGTVYSWGYNAYGELGNGTTYTVGCQCSPIPTQVSGLNGIIAIAIGAGHSLALKNDGTVWAWGVNADGQLGDSTTIDKYTPVRVKGLANVIKVSAGDYHSLAVKSDGTAWAWGYNLDGELGDGTTTIRYTAVQVNSLNGIIDIKGGSEYSFALKNDSTVWSWGTGVLGDSTFGVSLVPVQIHGPGNVKYLTGIKAISCNADALHSLALKSDGTVFTWGSDLSGQLGDTSFFSDSSIPVQVASLSNVAAIAGGNDFSLALKTDGTVWGWGVNVGQLGSGTLSKSPCGCDTLPVKANNLCPVVLSVNNVENVTKNVSVFPNPVSETGKIVFNNEEINEIHKVEIYNYSGIKVKESIFNGNSFLIESKDYAAGFYLFKITETNSKVVSGGKFIVLCN